MISRLIINCIAKRQVSLWPRIVVSRHLSSQNGTTTLSPSQRPIKTSYAKEHDSKFRIIKDVQAVQSPSLDEAKLAGSNVELDDLELELSGRKASFNLTWLRDSCHCDQCTHKHSRQRLFTPKDFSKRLFEVDEVSFLDNNSGKQFTGPSGDSDDGLLYIRWSDGHESHYSLSWLSKIDSICSGSELKLASLKRSRFALPTDDFYAAPQRFQTTPEYWSVSMINSSLSPVDYNDLLDGFEFHDDDPTFINANDLSKVSSRRYESMVSITAQLTKFGLAKIVNVPRERDQVLRVVRSLAYERPTGYGTIFDIVIEPSEEINLAYSSQEFDLHSDLTYRETSPGVQLLHCIKNSDQGGLSYFSDAFNAAQLLKEADSLLFEVLLQFPATFVVRDPYRDIKFRKQKPILALNQQGDLEEVYYSPFMLPPVGFKEDIKLFYLALDKYTQLLQAEENKLITKMDPGDLFMFHNRRVLHGRSSYDPASSTRFLQGCYMDWDEISCLHEKLITNKA